MKNVLRFAKDESGATAIEYGLIASLIAIAMIVGAGNIGSEIAKKFSFVASTIEKAPGATGG